MGWGTTLTLPSCSEQFPWVIKKQHSEKLWLAGPAWRWGREEEDMGKGGEGGRGKGRGREGEGEGDGEALETVFLI